jgi:tetratricopeptide (TPR) repeat protein
VSHPSQERLRRFVLARLPEAEEREIEAHLRGGSEPGAAGGDPCEICLYTLRELLPQAQFATEEGIRAFVDAVYRDEPGPRAADAAPASTPGGDPEDLFDQLARQALRRRFLLDREAALAPVLVDELLRRPPAARREAIRTGRRYQLYGLAEGLCESSRSAGFSDVARALELAELAVTVSDALDPRLYPPELLADRQALCRAFLGNARRVASDLFGADSAFQEAVAMLPLGTGNELPRADLWSLLGSLRVDQARYDEARRVLAEALEVYESWDEPENVGRTLLKIGLCAGYSGDAEEAVATFERAAAVLDPLGDERLTLYARHNLIHWLVERGDALQALASFRKARSLYDRLAADPWIALRRRWLEGQIHARLGDLSTAFDVLDEVRAEAARRELAYEHAMVTLELSILHLDRGDLWAARELAAGLLPVFRSQELHRHALAAVYLFEHAARQENAAATATLARQVLRYLQRARNNPYLRFQPG